MPEEAHRGVGGAVSRERVLVLGGGGMLGHKVNQVFRERFDTWATLRGQPPAGAVSLFDPARTITDVDVLDLVRLDQVLREVHPSVVINCVGVVKQLAEARDPVAAISINALFPHRLPRSCRTIGARVIHISTDCVFSGRRGNYSETDESDAADLYGRTKLLGEVTGEGALTIRTSIIGRELRGTTGLLEWFLSSAERARRWVSYGEVLRFDDGGARRPPRHDCRGLSVPVGPVSRIERSNHEAGTPRAPQCGPGREGVLSPRLTPSRSIAPSTASGCGKRSRSKHPPGIA